MTNMAQEIQLTVYADWKMEVVSPYHKGLVEGLHHMANKCIGTPKWRPLQPCARWDKDNLIWTVHKHHRKEVEALCRRLSLYFSVKYG